jgi:hypothetical protein
VSRGGIALVCNRRPWHGNASFYDAWNPARAIISIKYLVSSLFLVLISIVENPIVSGSNYDEGHAAAYEMLAGF